MSEHDTTSQSLQGRPCSRDAWADAKALDGNLTVNMFWMAKPGTKHQNESFEAQRERLHKP